MLLADGNKLWDHELRTIDEILVHEELVDLIDAALRRRHPLSSRCGRLGTPAVVVLRMLLLKHLRDWSFDECEREVTSGISVLLENGTATIEPFSLVHDLVVGRFTTAQWQERSTELGITRVALSPYDTQAGDWRGRYAHGFTSLAAA